MTERTITQAISIADQPSRDDLEALKGRGFVGVVNLRHDGEPEQPMSPSDEAEVARSLGMDYLHVPIGGSPLPEPGVAAVVAFLDRHPEGKVLVHCRKGGRAAALVLLHQARLHGWVSDEALAQGEAIGLKVEGNLRPLVEQYLTAREGRSS